LKDEDAKKAAIFFASVGFLFVGGCSSLERGDQELNKPLGYVEAKLIRLSVVNQQKIDQMCPGIRTEGRHPIGCAHWGVKSCEIYVLEKSAHEVLGHELRHCFEGAFHR
jgi:hypothetical protein